MLGQTDLIESVRQSHGIATDDSAEKGDSDRRTKKQDHTLILPTHHTKEKRGGKIKQLYYGKSPRNREGQHHHKKNQKKHKEGSNREKGGLEWRIRKESESG